MPMDGKSLSKEIIDWIKNDYHFLLEVRRSVFKKDNKKTRRINSVPSLKIIQIGDRADSNLFIRNKISICQKLGFEYDHEKLPEDISAGILSFI
jgi:5,10-methylene-tetrahydrofolate dehydrogenase/methenyl tetrahydrofolate cyclohydrolase